MAAQLDHHPVDAEQGHQPVQFGGRRIDPTRVQGGGDVALAASGQHHHPPAQRGTDRVQVIHRPALLTPGQLREGDHPGQPRVAFRSSGQDEQVPPGRVRRPVLRPRQLQRQLRPEHRRDAQLAGGVGEADHPVQAVVVGDRQPGQPQLVRLLDQLLRVRGPVQEAEVGVAVQLDIVHRRGAADQLRRRVAGPLARPGGRVTPVAAGRERVHDGRLARPSRQHRLQTRPRHVRIVKPHRSVNTTVSCHRRWPAGWYAGDGEGPHLSLAGRGSCHLCGWWKFLSPVRRVAPRSGHSGTSMCEWSWPGAALRSRSALAGRPGTCGRTVAGGMTSRRRWKASTTSGLRWILARTGPGGGRQLGGTRVASWSARCAIWVACRWRAASRCAGFPGGGGSGTGRGFSTW